MAIILYKNIMFIQILHVENYSRLEWIIKGMIFNWTFREIQEIAFCRDIPSHGIISILEIKIRRKFRKFRIYKGIWKKSPW